MNRFGVVVCIWGKLCVLYNFVPSLQHEKEVPKMYFIQKKVYMYLLFIRWLILIQTISSFILCDNVWPR